MTIYAGLDVSDKQTHICVVDADGAVIRRDCVVSDPEALSKWLREFRGQANSGDSEFRGQRIPGTVY